MYIVYTIHIYFRTRFLNNVVRRRTKNQLKINLKEGIKNGIIQ